MTMQGRTCDEARRPRAGSRSTTAAPTSIPSTPHHRRPGHSRGGLVRDADRPLDVVVVPVGGRGRAAGWLCGSRDLAEHPHRRSRARGRASMTAASEAGHPVQVPSLDTFSDGASVGTVGALTFPLVRDLVDEVVTADAGARVRRDAGALPERRDHRRARGRRGLHRARRARAGARLPRRLRGLGRQQRRQPLRRRDRAIDGARGDRHYFLVGFPQEPGALRGFLDHAAPTGRTSWSSSTSRSPTGRPAPR